MDEQVGCGSFHIRPLLLLLELWYTDHVNTSLFPANNKLPTGKLPAKIMAIDLDDTLLREDLTISDYTIKTLQKATAAGIYVTLCSGRTDNAILPFVRQLEIAGLEQGRFIIAQNGAVIYDLHLRREILYRTVDVEVLLEANEIAASYGLFPEVYNPTTIFTTQDNKWTQVDVGLTGLQMEVVPDFPALLRKGHPKMVIPGDQRFCFGSKMSSVKKSVLVALSLSASLISWKSCPTTVARARHCNGFVSVWPFLMNKPCPLETA